MYIPIKYIKHIWNKSKGITYITLFGEQSLCILLYIYVRNVMYIIGVVECDVLNCTLLNYNVNPISNHVSSIFRAGLSIPLRLRLECKCCCDVLRYFSTMKIAWDSLLTNESGEEWCDIAGEWGFSPSAVTAALILVILDLATTSVIRDISRPKRMVKMQPRNEYHI